MLIQAPYEKIDLLQRVAQGDEAAYAHFFRQYSRLIYSFIYEHTDSPELANDLVQDIFTKLWLIRETLPNIQNLGAYLFTLAHHHTINHIKKRVRERKRHQEWQEIHDSNEYEPETDIYLDFIEEAIQQLPEQQRKVWLLSRRGKKKYREIAQELGISQQTVKKYLQYANASITDYLLMKKNVLLLLFLYALYPQG